MPRPQPSREQLRALGELSAPYVDNTRKWLSVQLVTIFGEMACLDGFQIRELNITHQFCSPDEILEEFREVISPKEVSVYRGLKL
mmetsp:Transcript_10484/g.25602  ORF Transcript_10484/g.25602 Transcript_10484/m.25602 type:complete len:85 (-) Transcript_10484:604-858(-)